MSERQSDLQDAIESVHEEVPHQFQVSLTMSMDVRDNIREIRDELKDISGNADVTTNDVMRLALIAASHYHRLDTEGVTDPETLEQDQLRSLSSLINRVVAVDDSSAEKPTE